MAPRRAKLKPPASVRPWKAAILAVDPGESCGVSLWSRGVYLNSAVIDGYLSEQIGEWVARGLSAAMAGNLPLLLVMEKPPMGGRSYAGRNLYGASSVNGSRKVWAKVWEASHYTTNKLRVDVVPPTWRAAVLGCHRGPLLERVEVDRAERIAGREMATRDEAAAVGIGCWASRAGVVGAKLGKLAEVA